MMIALLTFFILCIFSVFITHPRLLISFDFYRRDGNVFISYLSLVVLICSAVNFDIWKIIKHFVYISTVASIAAIALHYLKMTKSYPEYWMFFTAHNAAGGFLGMVCIFNFALVGKTKARGIPFLCLFVNLFSLYLTNSRGSIFPLIGAFIYLFMVRKTVFKSFDIVINVLIFIAMFLFVVSVVAVRGEDTLVHVSSFSLPEEFEGSMIDRFVSSIGRGGTIVDRLYYLYPKAIYMFNLSPFIGVGMGTFNDIPIDIVGIPNFISLNLGEAINNDSHAHNSFFHILAENGILGFSMVVLFLWYVRSYSKKIKDKHLSNLIFLGINFAILSSFTEHRLFTPSEMLPFIYILGMIISKENYRIKKESYVKECSSC